MILFRVGNENCQPLESGLLFFSAHDPPGCGSLITRWLSLKEAPSFLIGLEAGDIIFSKRALAFFVRLTILVLWESLRERIETSEFHLAEPR